MHFRYRFLKRRTVLLFIFTGALLFVLNVFNLQRDLYEPLTDSGIMAFSNLLEGRKPKQVLIHPKRKCEDLSRKNTVIMVLSKASNRLQRETIRRTWGNPQMQIEYNFSLYFVIGNEKELDYHEIRAENDDILHVDVEENYFKITEKVIEAMHWATNSCFDSHFFLKIDDDVYFNLKFLREIQRNKQYIVDDVIYGDCLLEAKPKRSATKFIVSKEEYPFTLYPPYCGGPGYVMTLHTARKIYYGLTHTTMFMFEDVYIGIVAYKLGISMKNIDNFVYAMDGYFHRLNIDCAIITHNLTPELITNVWSEQLMTQNNDTADCSNFGTAKYILRSIFSVFSS